MNIRIQDLYQIHDIKECRNFPTLCVSFRYENTRFLLPVYQKSHAAARHLHIPAGTFPQLPVFHRRFFSCFPHFLPQFRTIPQLPERLHFWNLPDVCTCFDLFDALHGTVNFAQHFFYNILRFCHALTLAGNNLLHALHTFHSKEESLISVDAICSISWLD